MKNNYIVWYYNKKNNIIEYKYYNDTYNDILHNNNKQNNEHLYIKLKNLKILAMQNYKNIINYFTARSILNETKLIFINFWFFM
jgi:hypothetical protein